MFGLLVLLALATYNFASSLQNSFVLDEEAANLLQEDDLLVLIGNVVNRTQPTSIGVIVDSVFLKRLGFNFVASLNGKMIITMFIEDSESFDDEPSKKVQSMLITMKEIRCDFYVILITDGTKASGFLKYADNNRLLNTRAKILMLYDSQLFSPGFHYLWKRIINVIFMRKSDTKLNNWYELSTVPFPFAIQDVFLPRVINFWSPPNRYRWRKEIFDDKFNNNLNGLKLSVAVLQHTPTVFKMTIPGDENETAVYSGLEMDLMQTLSNAMNISLEIYETSDADTEKWGRERGKGNFTGLLGEMVGARADFALGDLHYTTFNLNIMDLSLPYNIECLTFITPELLSDNSWKTLLSPFSMGMWIGVLLSLGFIGAVFYIFSKSYTLVLKEKGIMEVRGPKPKDFFDDLSACVLYTYSMILLVSLPRMPIRWSVRVLTGWWWIYCILLVVAYRAALTSILANPQPRLTIDSLEVLSSSWLKCGAWGDQNRGFFTMSVDSAAQKIGAKLEHVDDAYTAIDRVAGGDFAYFENQFTLQELRFQQEEKKDSAQNLHIMEECAVNIPISVGLDKNSPFKERIDKLIRRLIEGGFIQKWLMQAIKRFESSVEPPPPEALMDLRKFYGALVALGCGYFLALLAFITEKAYWRFVVERHPHYDKYYRQIIFLEPIK